MTSRTATAGSVALIVLAASCVSPDSREPGIEGVVDDVGHVHARQPPRTRIVSLIPAATETLVAMGAADRLVARTRYDEQPELAALPILSGVLEPSVEALADLEPDLVIMWPTGGDGGPIGERLVQIGLNWYGAAINTVADFERHAANLGELLGLEDRADSVVAAVREEMAAARASWPGRDPLEIFYVVQKEPPMTVGPGTFLDAIFSAGGAVNSFGDVEGNWPSISLEQIVWRNPEYLIVPVEGYGTPRVATGSRIRPRTAWQRSSGGRNSRPWRRDGSYRWTRPSSDGPARAWARPRGTLRTGCTAWPGPCATPPNRRPGRRR